MQSIKLRNISRTASKRNWIKAIPHEQRCTRECYLLKTQFTMDLRWEFQDYQGLYWITIKRSLKSCKTSLRNKKFARTACYLFNKCNPIHNNGPEAMDTTLNILKKCNIYIGYWRSFKKDQQATFLYLEGEEKKVP